MQRIELQELRERASELLTGTEALTVERQGQAIGLYLPLPHAGSQDTKDKDGMAALRAAVAAALANGQMTQEELADFLDLRHPVLS